MAQLRTAQTGKIQALPSILPKTPPELQDATPSRRRRSRAKTQPPKSRIPHACDRCRVLRTRCSGGERCARCTKDDAECQYRDRKRERDKKWDPSKIPLLPHGLICQRSSPESGSRRSVADGEPQPSQTAAINNRPPRSRLSSASRRATIFRRGE
jgi:hypothetical protein